MTKMCFQHHYSSLQCLMILRKSFDYASLVLKEHFLLVLMLKTVVLLNIFVETETFFQHSLIKAQKNRIHLK